MFCFCSSFFFCKHKETKIYFAKYFAGQTDVNYNVTLQKKTVFKFDGVTLTEKKITSEKLMLDINIYC